MNNSKRELWIYNDKFLYLLWKQSQLSMQNFIKENRIEIDKHINEQMNQKEIE